MRVIFNLPPFLFHHGSLQRNGARALKRAINAYKFDGVQGWASIFGRVLAGYLDAHRGVFSRYDLITPRPTFTGTGGLSFDHTASVIERAAIEDRSWPFAVAVVTKAAGTTPLSSTRSWRQRFEIAEGELRNALVVGAPELVRGRHMLAFADIYTEGLTIREVARALKAYMARPASPRR